MTHIITIGATKRFANMAARAETVIGSELRSVETSCRLRWAAFRRCLIASLMSSHLEHLCGAEGMVLSYREFIATSISIMADT